MEINGKATMPEFTENLRGVSAGEERTFDVVYALDQRPAARGKDFYLHGESTGC